MAGLLMDMAMGSFAQFLAVSEHRVIPARARSIDHQLRKAGCHSVWAPACQDRVSGGHDGVVVVSLCGSSLFAPSLVTPEFREFFRLGRATRVAIPTGRRREGLVTSLLCNVIRWL